MNDHQGDSDEVPTSAHTSPDSGHSAGSAPAPTTHLESEVSTQPENWAAAAAIAAEHRAVLPRPGERVAVVGCGTSLFMSRAIAALREEAGQGLTDAWPASQLRLGREYDRYLFICRSGTTTEVVRAMEQIPAHIPRTVVCSSPGTPVLELGDAILIDEVDEKSVVQTRFATTTLAILRWHLGEDLAAAIAQAREVLAEDPAESLAAVRRAEQISFVGMGFAAAIADEAGLKLRESCQAWTEGYLATEYRHGPISIAAPGRAVWAFGPLEPGFAEDVAVTGAHLEHREIDPMADLVRVQQLCLLRAADLGLDADHPRNLNRSIILEQ